ncbi:MAG: PEP-CTERM sorting domain-containing protein [Pseudomonadota bacterium]
MAFTITPLRPGTRYDDLAIRLVTNAVPLRLESLADANAHPPIAGEAGADDDGREIARARHVANQLLHSMLRAALDPALGKFTRVIIEITTATAPHDQKPGVIAQATRAHAAMADLATRAHEHRIRHFLIHDWPGPGQIGVPGASSAKLFTASLASDPEEGSSDLDDAAISDAEDIVCEYSDLGDQDCPPADDLVGRMPPDYSARVTGPAGSASQTLKFTGDSVVTVGAGLVLGSQGSNSGGGGSGPAGNGDPLGSTTSNDGVIDFENTTGGPSFPPGQESLDPSASVPLPGALAFLLAGLGAFAIFRRKNAG